MIKYILLFFILLWLLGFVQIPFLTSALFFVLGHPITLQNLLLLTLFVFIIQMLPGTFRTIALVLLAMWILSLLGFFVFSGAPNLVTFVLIIAVLFYIF